VLIEPDRQGVDLPLQLAEPAGQPVPLFPEGLGQRHHGLDEPALAVVGRRGVAHRSASSAGGTTASKDDAARAYGRTAGSSAHAPVVGLTG
jgi:hypothetical protein